MKEYIGVKVVKAEPSKATKDYGNHKAGEDGYKVVYPDGYESWSPKDVFEEAYRECSGMPFGAAIEAMKKGKKVARAGWNGKGMWIAAQFPDESSKMDGGPYAYISNPAGKLFPWNASQQDLFAEDWGICD